LTLTRYLRSLHTRVKFSFIHILREMMMRLAMMMLAATAALPALAATTDFKIALTGDSEVPGPGAKHGSGEADLTFDTSKGNVCYTLHAKGIMTSTMAHIHKGAVGVAGPPVAPLTPPNSTEGMSSGCAPLPADVLSDILANPANYYVNIHTSAYPKGALRGQIK
jgi:hypothetical protein